MTSLYSTGHTFYFTLLWVTLLQYVLLYLTSIYALSYYTRFVLNFTGILLYAILPVLLYVSRRCPTLPRIPHNLCYFTVILRYPSLSYVASLTTQPSLDLSLFSSMTVPRGWLHMLSCLKASRVWDCFAVKSSKCVVKSSNCSALVLQQYHVLKPK